MLTEVSGNVVSCSVSVLFQAPSLFPSVAAS